MPSSTDFVVASGFVTAQSFQPCHLFGDGDIYGIGIRTSFYIGYGAAIIALLSNLNPEITQSLVLLSIVSLASFINLCINSTGDNLVIIDWMVILALTYALPIFAFWRPIYYFWTWRKAKKESEIETIENVVARRAVELLVDVEYYEFQLAEHLRVIGDDEERLWVDYSRAVNAFYAHFGLRVPAHLDYLIDYETLEEIFVQGLRKNIKMDTDTAEQLTNLAWYVVLGKLRKKYFEYIVEENKGHVSKALFGYGCIVLIWAAYIAALPWLFWKGIARGRKEGCNIKTMEIFFVPLNIYSRGHVIVLRVLSIIHLVAAAVFVIIFVFVTLFVARRGWKKFIEKRRLWKHAERMLVAQLVAAAYEEARKREEAEAHKQAQTIDRAGAYGQIEHDDQVTAQEDNDTTPAEAPQTESKKPKELRIVRREFSNQEWMRDKHFRRKIYLNGSLICLLALVVTVIVVEFTVRRVNHVDLSSSSVSTPGQLLPLLVSVFSALPIVVKAAKKLFNKIMFPGEADGKRFDRWYAQFKRAGRKTEKQEKEDVEAA